MQKIVIYSIIIVFLFFTKSLIAQDSTAVKETKKQKREKARLEKFQSKVNSDSVYFIPYSDNSSIKKVGEKKELYFNNKLPSSYISFLISPNGGSIPVGSFGKMNFDDSKKEPGFAERGSNQKIEAAYYFYKRFGLHASYGRQTHFYSYRNFNSEYEGINVGLSYSLPRSSDAYLIYAQELDKKRYTWKTSYLMIGPIYSFKLGKILTIDLKASFGKVTIAKPSLFLEHYIFYSGHTFAGYLGSVDVMYTSSLSKGIGYSFGTNIRCNLHKRFSLMVSADFLQSNCNISYLYYKTISESSDIGVINNNQKKEVINRNYNFATFNISFGAAFQLIRKGK